ncbi:MAG: ATP-binding cassette domain-containing protein [Streptosporangiales bacterium]|nr:ATP-binding cassette domain-containing protein [Streptosporangiales bacterium]
MTEPVLSIQDLSVTFRTSSGYLRAVDEVSYDVYPGETLGVVGESGSGKSVTVMSLLRLVPESKRMTRTGAAYFRGRDLLKLSKRELRAVRGNEIALVPQDPMTCLDPLFKVGDQIGESIWSHNPGIRGKALRDRAVELLELVDIPQPERRYTQYPHEYSGGMRQRAMIAMGMANDPSLLIADEPTTALDVTIQAQILEVLKEAQRETNAGVILITHDLGLIAEMADRVVVMYAGHVVETGDVQTIFERPRHPYTLGLMNSLPQAAGNERWLKPIPGSPPNMANVPSGCPFHPRCLLSQGRERCRTELPVLTQVDGADHQAACHFSHEVSTKAAELLDEAEHIT